MANIYIAKYTIEGNNNDINNLYSILKEIENENKYPKCRWGFYYGEILEKLGYNEEYCNCRGGFENLRKKGNVIKFDSYSAYSLCYGLFETLKNKFPSINYYYKGIDEFGQFPFTNDVDKKHYKYGKKYEVQDDKEIATYIYHEIIHANIELVMTDDEDKKSKLYKIIREELPTRYPQLPFDEILKKKK